MEKDSALIRDEMTKRIIDVAERLATEGGAHNLTVRQILRELGASNRVFYNRFRNIEEVLEIIYENTVKKIRASLPPLTNIRSGDEFFDYVTELVTASLVSSYDFKMNFNQYIFENDSSSEYNRTWWTTEISKLIEFAKEKKYIKNVNSETLSYALWCFCRGYNADAVARGLPRDEAIEGFKYSFSFFLEGLKLQNNSKGNIE